jgi:uncharacterized membrane protein YvbJ
MRPERLCPTCGSPKNEDDELCNLCLENGESTPADELE